MKTNAETRGAIKSRATLAIGESYQKSICNEFRKSSLPL
jgi:hypothetical protein